MLALLPFPTSRLVLLTTMQITCAIAVFALLFMVKFPDQERHNPSFRFLKPEELEHVISQLQNDRGDVEAEPFTWKLFLTPAMDWEIWGFAFMQLYGTHLSIALFFSLASVHKAC